MAIGLLAAVAQSCLSQDGTAGGMGSVGWLPERQSHFRERFAELLYPGGKEDRAAGWQYAAALGLPAMPLLWEMHRSEPADVSRRLATLAAAMIAGGTSEDSRVFIWLGQQKPMFEERVLAAMVLALGPQRQRPQPDFWLRCFGPTKDPELLMQVAVRLAAARFPGSLEGAPAFVGDDPGVAAASAFAGLPVPLSVAAKWGSVKSHEDHSELFWRGAMHGAARRWRAGERQPDSVLDLAREVLAGKGRTTDDGRAAAAWLCARSGMLQPDGQALDLRVLSVAVADPATAQRFAAQLGPVAQPRDPEPRRLAVAYALTRPIQGIVDQRAEWAADANISSHIALALAWRLLGPGAGEPIQPVVANVPEWAFVRWASGAGWESQHRFEDPSLQMAAHLCAEVDGKGQSRISRAALRERIEQSLWLRGSHPGLVAWRQERLMVRDLLLVGSNCGGGKYQSLVRLDRRYFPTGLDRDDVFFPIAVDLFDFLSVPRLPIPAEYRLGN